NGHKFKYIQFHLNTRKHFSTVRVVKLWNRFPREIVESPPLEILKSQLDMVMGNLL
ncbi:hypothetical protein N328_01408, partial [Gavia stellata]